MAKWRADQAADDMRRGRVRTIDPKCEIGGEYLRQMTSEELLDRPGIHSLGPESYGEI